MVDLGIGLLHPEAFHGAHDRGGVEWLAALRRIPVDVPEEQRLHLHAAAGPSFALEFAERLPGAATAGSVVASAVVRDGGVTSTERAVEVVGIHFWDGRKTHREVYGWGGGEYRRRGGKLVMVVMVEGVEEKRQSAGLWPKSG